MANLTTANKSTCKKEKITFLVDTNRPANKKVTDPSQMTVSHPKKTQMVIFFMNKN